MNLSPQDIKQVQEWLKDKQSYIVDRVSDDYLKGVSKVVVEAVFNLLQSELDYEWECNADDMKKLLDKIG